MKLIKRTIAPVIVHLATQYPVVTITGPRQSGKTTLCRHIFSEKPYANLEAPDTRQFVLEDPRGFLSRFPDGAVIDEIQRAPDLVSYIQPMVDDSTLPGQFILTGSQQFEVSNTVNQSLAGRSALVRLLPFDVEEISKGYGLPDIDHLMVHGFYPRIWDRQLNPTQALGDYFETYIERDLRQLAAIKDLHVFQRFITLCAGRTGQLLNLNRLANDTGISHTTARNWISLLEASYVIFLLQPYFENISKRLVKTPKLYFYDVGLANFLLGIENALQLSRDPLRGHLVENLVVAEAVKYHFNRGKRPNLFFYRDSKGNEVDLLLLNGREFFPIEIRASMTLSRDSFKGIRHFNKLFPERIPHGSGLVYCGEEAQNRTGIKVVPWFRATGLFQQAGFDAIQT